MSFPSCLLANRRALLTLILASGVSCLTACGGGGGSPAAAQAKRILYQQSVPVLGGGLQSDLRVVNEDGTGDTALASSTDNEAPVIIQGVPLVVGDRLIYLRTTSNGLHDVYSVKLDGTGTLPLANALAIDETVIGALGDRVMVSSAGRLRTMKADGTAPYTFPSNAEFVSVSNGRIVYTAQAGLLRSTFSALPDGSASALLLDYELEAAQGYAPSANGSSLVRLDIDGRALLGSTAGNQPLYLASPDGASLQRLAVAVTSVGPAPNQNASHPGAYLLRAGDHLVYTRERSTPGIELHSVKLDGTQDLLLATTSDISGLVDVVGTRALYFTLEGSQTVTYSVEVAGGTPRPIATGALPSRTSGSRLLVVSDATGNLYSMNPDGSDPIPLATATVSPFGAVPLNLGRMGARVLFLKANASNPAVNDIYAVGNDGSALVPLATGADEKAPEAIGPERLYFRRVLLGQSDLYSIRPDGTGLATLANSTSDERVALIVGDKVVISRQAADGHHDLAIVNGDGSAPKTLGNSAWDKVALAAF